MMESVLSRDLSSGEAFREARKEMKLSQMQMAKLLGMSVPSISRIEIGKARVNQRTELAVKLLLMVFHKAARGEGISGDDSYRLLSRTLLGRERGTSVSGQRDETQPATA